MQMKYPVYEHVLIVLVQYHQGSKSLVESPESITIEPWTKLHR